MNTALSVGKGISVMGREEATTQRLIYRSQDTQKIRSLTGRHVTISRAISFILSLGLCGVGMFLVLFPRQVIQATTTPSTVPTDCNNDPNRDFQNSITYGEETYEFTQCRILGSVLAAFGISTFLSLLQFTMHNGIRCFFRESKAFRVSARYQAQTAQEALDLQLKLRTILCERQAELSKCRCALVSHAELGLLWVLVGLVFHKHAASDVNPNPINTTTTTTVFVDCDEQVTTNTLTLVSLVGGCLLVALASLGLMASFWPVLVQRKRRQGESYSRLTQKVLRDSSSGEDVNPDDYYDCSESVVSSTEEEEMRLLYKRVRFSGNDINGGAFSHEPPRHVTVAKREATSSSSFFKWCCALKKRSIYDVEQTASYMRTQTDDQLSSLKVPFLKDALLDEEVNEYEDEDLCASSIQIGSVDLNNTLASIAEHDEEDCESEMTQTMEGTIDGRESPKSMPQNHQDIDEDDYVSLVESRITGIRRLLQLVSPQKPILYIACLTLLIRLPFSLAMPHFVSTTFGALARFDYDKARQEVMLLAIVGTIDAALDFWCVWLFGMANLRIVRKLRLDTFASLLKQDVSFFDENQSGELTSRLTADCGQMASELTWVFRFSIEALVRITGIASYMVWRSPLLASGTLVLVPIIALVNKFYGAFLERNAKATQESLAEANAIAQETLACARTVIAYATEDLEVQKYESKIDRGFNLSVRELFARGLYYMVICTFLINTVVQGSILLFGTLLIQRGQLTVEVLLAFMLYQGQLQEYTLQLFQSYTSLLRSSGAGDKVFELLDRVPPSPGTGSREVRLCSAGAEGLEISTDEEKDVLRANSSIDKHGSNAIEFQNIYFTYPSRPQHLVLRGLTLEIPSGDTVALVGASGCGKSTIVSLVERFYDPAAGIIKIGGQRLDQIPLKQHRQRVGIVTQDPVLFSGTILSNILYGNRRATLDDAINAARLANAHDFIESFDQGYFSQVGERGVQLSGGQKQRIAIARAILKQPSILLLDEATSALDTESEKLVQDALDRLLFSSMNTTTIVVAHRLQTVKNADLIAVISQGVIVEQGSHRDLMSLPNGHYKKMVECSDFQS